MRNAAWRRLAVAVAFGLMGALVLHGSEAPLTERERIADAVRAFVASGNRMTPDQVRRSFGEPDEVFRDNPRALCWAYAEPYAIRMCWGPKRQAAWIGYSIPSRVRRY